MPLDQTKNKTLLPGTRGSDTPHPVDVHVGQRVKLRRTLMGMTQGKLGESIGLTFQQVQKYERGANRVSASKLWQLGNVLDVPVAFFFEDMPQSVRDSFPGYEGETAESDIPEEHLTLHRRQSLELVRTFSRLQAQVLRKRVIDMVRAIAESETVKA
jgi:transcriptional regulator with XRE-family HTH domain